MNRPSLLDYDPTPRLIYGRTRICHGWTMCFNRGPHVIDDFGNSVPVNQYSLNHYLRQEH